ncbi:signal peptidase I [Salegentibacter sp. Hel_I_6]|uniref:signal peptidase I n=1 Tax=Salegentibacter sp. Hel_I_6 TaxID=1250278 RepID=UPI00056A02CD|nr:signal peptidase I [Salegentibacter sp. Hel_I_6]
MGGVINKIKAYWKSLLLTLLVLFPLLFGLYWLSALIILGMGSYWLIQTAISAIKFTRLQQILEVLVGILYFFIVITSIKVFLLDIYRIPSSSMEKTIFPGDVILVNKLAYGPIMPRKLGEIRWLNLFLLINEDFKEIIDEPWWSYHRLKGAQEIEQGDILVYELRPSFFVVKRCVGVAGDDFQVIDGVVYTNEKIYDDPKTVKNIYDFQVTERSVLYDSLNSLGLEFAVSPGGNFPNSLRGDFTILEKEKVQTIPGVNELNLAIDTLHPERKLFAEPPLNSWTLDNLGPFRIPKKGTTFSLKPETFALYAKAISLYEEVKLVEKSGKYYIDGKQVKEYTFTKDYYFMMGDHRKGSIDSRYVGFIPKENIIGKVPLILFSTTEDESQWNRLLKPIAYIR